MDEMQSPSDDAEQYAEYGRDLDLEGDTLREECGVFGIFGHPEAAAITALGLHALQHRGQEAAGIVSFDGTRFHSERRLGLVGDTFSRREVIERLPGNAAIGHVRYSTTGATSSRFSPNSMPVASPSATTAISRMASPCAANWFGTAP
jgi:amidophosphoribosyltransferase